MELTSNANTATEHLRPITPLFLESSPPSFPSTSWFFRLPREIRDEIYITVLRGFSTRIRHDREMEILIRYGDNNFTRGTGWLGLPSMFMANKTLLSELLAELYRRSRCVTMRIGFDSDRSAPYFAPGPYTLITLDRVRVIDLTHYGDTWLMLAYSFGIIPLPDNQKRSPLATERQTLRCTLSSTLSPAHEKSRIPTAPPFCLFLLGEKLKGQNHCVREVEYQIKLPGGPQGSSSFPETSLDNSKNDDLELKIDLSELERWMPTTESVVFNIDFPLETRYSSGMRRAPPEEFREFEMVQTALLELGLKVIGKNIDDEEGWFMEDWVKVSQVVRKITANAHNGFLAKWCLRVSRSEHGGGRKQFRCRGLQYYHVVTMGCEEFLLRRDENVPWMHGEDMLESPGWKFVGYSAMKGDDSQLHPNQPFRLQDELTVGAWGYEH